MVSRRTPADPVNTDRINGCRLEIFLKEDKVHDGIVCSITTMLLLIKCATCIHAVKGTRCFVSFRGSLHTPELASSNYTYL